MSEYHSVVDKYADLSDDDRRFVFANLTLEERAQLEKELAYYSPFYHFRGNPLGFVRALETTWSAEEEILEAIAVHKKVLVVATHGVSKSHTASRAAAAVACSWPAELVRVLTTAPTWRQVEGILWPYIQRLHGRHDLPGEVHSTMWKIGPEKVGQGFATRDNTENAFSGFHVGGELFLIVDEAGGIPAKVGHSFQDVLTDNAHILAIGNFPTDTESAWINEIAKSSEWHVIRIPAFRSPNFPRPGGEDLRSLSEVKKWIAKAEEDPALHAEIYEKVGDCASCPTSIPTHSLSRHLVDLAWVEDVAREFGEDSAYYRARVMAEEPTELAPKAIPALWLEAAIRKNETSPGPIRIGVDPAVDGGDEFVIARGIGGHASIRYAKAGIVNKSLVASAGFVLEEILLAEAYHREHGIAEKVVVKVDSIGVGHGTYDLLVAWGNEGKHHSTIVEVVSSKQAHNPARFPNQRSEMWWHLRGILNPEIDGPEITLDIGVRELAQLNAPEYSTSSEGKISIQGKPEIKKEKGWSPDRADAILLVFYDPPVVDTRHGVVTVPKR